MKATKPAPLTIHGWTVFTHAAAVSLKSRVSAMLTSVGQQTCNRSFLPHACT